MRWGEQYSKLFEATMLELGAFLGFGSHRPEVEIGKGPDNLWALGGLYYLVIECKSGATSAPKVSKKDTNQLNGSIVWFKQTYDTSCTFTPIMVHPKTQFEAAASPDPDIRVVHEPGLKSLKDAVRAFTTALTSNGKFKDAKEVERQLLQHHLNSQSIVELMSVKQMNK